LGGGTGIDQWGLRLMDGNHCFCLLVASFLAVVALYIQQHCMLSGRGICFDCDIVFLVVDGVCLAVLLV